MKVWEIVICGREMLDMLQKYCISMDDCRYGSSIEDDMHMARYIQDVICDPDGYEGIVLCRFIADCNAKGIGIFWDMML